MPIPKPRGDESEDDFIAMPIHGGAVLIDKADLPLFNSRPQWFLAHRRHMQYAIANRPKGMVYLHQLLLPCGQVDHINRNGLDNRRSNLRPASGTLNGHNRNKYGGTSRFIGVTWHKGGQKWEAQISAYNQHHYLGLFDDEVEAAKARDNKAVEIFGTNARLNFGGQHAVA